MTTPLTALPVVSAIPPPSATEESTQHVNFDEEKDSSIPEDKSASGSEDVVEQEDGVTRIEALCKHSLIRCMRVAHLSSDLVFGKGWGLYSLWISIGLIAYVYSLSRSTTVYCEFMSATRADD
jgi:hypothetical protein